MKFVMSLVVAASFAVPAFASEKEAVAVKNQKDIAEVTKAAKKAELNEEEKRGAGAYRLVELKDPNINAKKSIGGSVDIAGFNLKPKVGTTRRWHMTPEEKREEDEGKTYINPQGTRLTRASTESRPTHVGITITKKFGAKQ